MRKFHTAFIEYDERFDDRRTVTRGTIEARTAHLAALAVVEKHAQLDADNFTIGAFSCFGVKKRFIVATGEDYVVIVAESKATVEGAFGRFVMNNPGY